MYKGKLAKDVQQQWWSDVVLPNEWRDKYNDTVEEYLETQGLEPEDLHANVETCKTLIPYLGPKIAEWDKFPVKFFLVANYPAHKALLNTVMHKLDSLVKEKA